MTTRAGLVLGLGAIMLVLGVAATAFASTSAGIINHVLTDLRDGKFSDVTSHLDERGKAAVSPQRLETVWNSQTSGDGKLVRWVTINASNANGSDTRLFRLHFENRQTLLLTIAVNESSGQITTLLLRPDAPTTPATSPPYADQKSFRSEDVRIGSAPFELAGVLTIPATGAGPWPA